MAKNRVVAIDIGTNTAKIVQLEQSDTTVQLTHASTVTYADKDDRMQVAESVRHLWASLGDMPVAGGIRSLFNRNKTEVALALPRSLVNTKRLSNLPAATDEQLASIVAIAAETELPFRVEEAIFTYHDVQQTQDASSVELISTRRTTVSNHLDLLEDMGVSVSAVTPSMIAIAEVAANSGCTKPTFIVDIGAEHSDFCFMQDGKLRFSRSFRFGGNQLSDHLSRTLDMTVDTAAAEKQHLSAHDSSVQPWTTQFIGELRRSIAAAPLHSDAEESPSTETELWLCGGGARLPDLAATCEAELNMSTRLWNPLEALRQHAGIEIHPGHPTVETILEEWGDTLAVPLGVGLNRLQSTTPVSLLPKEAVETLTHATRQRHIFAVAGGCVLLLGAVFFGISMLQRSRHYRSETVTSQLESYARTMPAAQKQLGKELALTEMLAHQVSPLDILHAFSEMFKDRTQVAWTNFNITNLHEPTTARITFNLESNSHNAINMLLRALDRSGVFTNVRPGEVTTISQERKQVFQVQIRCNLTTSAVKAFAKKRYPLLESQSHEAVDMEPEDTPPLPEALENEINKQKE